MPRTDPLSPSINQLTNIPAAPEEPLPLPNQNGGPKMLVPEEKPLAGWNDLPADILGVLFTHLVHQAQSVFQAPIVRFEALQTLYQLRGVARQENSLLNIILKNQQLDLKALEKNIRLAMREEWKNNAAGLADQRDKLIKDFAATRELIVSADSTGIPLALPESCEGVHLKFSEISLSPAIATFISVLEAKTVKLDATGIGRERFINEVLPALEKLPKTCKVVLDACNNELTAADLGKLSNVMAKQPVIYRLDLSGNLLADGENPAQIAQLFRHAGPLTHLYLEGTGFDTTMALALNQDFSQAHCLQHLDLRNNLLDEEGAIALIKATLPDVNDEKQLARLDSLRAVRLGGNPFLNQRKVLAAELKFSGDWSALRIKAYYRSLNEGNDMEYPSDAPEVFEIYGPSADPIAAAYLRMHDTRADARRL